MRARRREPPPAAAAGIPVRGGRWPSWRWWLLVVTGRLVVPGRVRDGLSHQVPGRDRRRGGASTASIRTWSRPSRGRRAASTRGGVARGSGGPHAAHARHGGVDHRAGRLEGAEGARPHGSGGQPGAGRLLPGLSAATGSTATRRPPSRPTTPGRTSVAGWVEAAGGADAFGLDDIRLPRDARTSCERVEQLPDALRAGPPATLLRQDGVRR